MLSSMVCVFPHLICVYVLYQDDTSDEDDDEDEEQEPEEPQEGAVPEEFMFAAEAVDIGDNMLKVGTIYYVLCSM